MKKMIGSLLGLAIIGAMIVPVSADDASTTLTYNKTSEYTLSIPASVTVSSVTVTEQAIGVSAINTSNSDKVQIAVKSGVAADGKIILTRTGSGAAVTTEVTASLTSGGTGISANEVISEFQDQSLIPTKGGKLYFSTIPTDADAGSYIGTIVFTASVVTR